MLVDLPPEDDPNAVFPDYPGKLKIVVRREPYDDSYSILLPNGNSEYVLVDAAERILKSYGIKNTDKILTHVWNFYLAVVYVNNPLRPISGK